MLDFGSSSFPQPNCVELCRDIARVEYGIGRAVRTILLVFPTPHCLQLLCVPICGSVTTQDLDETYHNILETVKRTTHELSHSLYSSDVHFLFEIIQNADDNNVCVSCTLCNARMCDRLSFMSLLRSSRSIVRVSFPPSASRTTTGPW